MNEEFTCPIDTRKRSGDYNMAKGNRDDFYQQQHLRNIKAFKELVNKVTRGFFKIISIQIDEPQFGHRRVVILIHDDEE